MPDAMNVSARDVVMPVVPMFHANAWGIPYVTTMTGAKQVMPGAKMDGASIPELLESEGVTFTAAVPTVWLLLLSHMRETGKTLSTLKRVCIAAYPCTRPLPERFVAEHGRCDEHRGRH